MERVTVSAEELRKTLGRHILAVANSQEVTVVLYHGVPSVAIVLLAYVPEE